MYRNWNFLVCYRQKCKMVWPLRKTIQRFFLNQNYHVSHKSRWVFEGAAGSHSDGAPGVPQSQDRKDEEAISVF